MFGRIAAIVSRTIRNGTAEKDVKVKQNARPAPPMSQPPIDGPRTRAPLNAAAFSATALWRCFRSTSAGTIERRAGQSNAAALPTMRAMVTRCQYSTNSVMTRNVSRPIMMM